MVEEMNLKSEPLRISWTAEEVQYRMSDGFRWRIITRPHIWRPPTDVYELEDAVVVRVEIAGVRESDFNISLENQFLTIRGVRNDISERRAYHQMEIPFGEFGVDVELPHPIIADKIDAVYRDGFLRITLPKSQPRRIPIKD